VQEGRLALYARPRCRCGRARQVRHLVVLVVCRARQVCHLVVLVVVSSPRLVWLSWEFLGVCFITAGPSTKLFAWGGGEDSGGHVLRETTSRGLCGLVCPSHTSEHGG